MFLELVYFFKFVNWSIFLFKKYRKDYVYIELVFGRCNYLFLVFMDIRVLFLLVNDF